VQLKKRRKLSRKTPGGGKRIVCSLTIPGKSYTMSSPSRSLEEKAGGSYWGKKKPIFVVMSWTEEENLREMEKRGGTFGQFKIQRVRDVIFTGWAKKRRRVNRGQK